jgi:hypothetical protein
MINTTRLRVQLSSNTLMVNKPSKLKLILDNYNA